MRTFHLAGTADGIAVLLDFRLLASPCRQSVSGATARHGAFVILGLH